MAYSPEQLRVLKQVLGSSAVKLAGALRLSLADAEKFLQNVNEFVKNSPSLDKQKYVLALSPSNVGNEKLTSSIVQGQINGKTPIISVDLELNLIGSSTGEARNTSCSKRTLPPSNSFEVLISGSYIWYFLAGATIEEVDTKEPGRDLPPVASWFRKFSELDKIIDDYTKERLNREQLRYWKDAKLRILLNEPDSTEELFHRDFLWWLKHWVLDAPNIWADPTGLGQDKTDINVGTVEGPKIIELKWLGTNGHTTYYQSRIDEGLQQVKLYLDRDANIIEGHLLVYDGRKEEDHKTKSDHNDSGRHPRCSLPKILFLESESPSKKAPKLASAAKKSAISSKPVKATSKK